MTTVPGDPDHGLIAGGLEAILKHGLNFVISYIRNVGSCRIKPIDHRAVGVKACYRQPGPVRLNRKRQPDVLQADHQDLRAS
jgi:hypothetical protein